MTAHEKATAAVSRQIMLKFQGHDLARETDDGMVQMSGRQIELLERLCNEAAGAAITAYLASMQEQGWVMVPREPTEAMTNAVPAVHHESFKAIWPKICADVYRAMLAAKEG
jgi:hypothetical protein